MDETRYACTVFLNAVVPLLRHVVAADPALARAFSGRTAVVQISALTGVDGGTGAIGDTGADGRPDRVATHLVITDGEVRPVLGSHLAPNLELEFAAPAQLVAFFSGKVALPKLRGALSNTGLLVATVQALLSMSKLLGAATPPKTATEQALLTKLLFYLLSTGISQLNKAGHPVISAWAKRQPDRVYAWTVGDDPDLAAYVRVKAGRSKAVRGRYTRSQPFFAMHFDTPRSALGVLLEVDDMLELTASGQLTMQGAPEYGAELGDLMLIVGRLAKGA